MLLLHLNRYNKALSYYTKFEDKEGRATLYTNLGSVYESQGFISDAVVCYTQGINLCKELNKKDGLAALYNNLGVLYKNKVL